MSDNDPKLVLAEKKEGHDLGLNLARKRKEDLQKHKEKFIERLEKFREAMHQVKAIPRGVSGYDFHFEHINPDDLTLDDAEIYEKLQLGTLGFKDYTALFNRPDVQANESRSAFYQYIANRFQEQLLKAGLEGKEE